MPPKVLRRSAAAGRVAISDPYMDTPIDVGFPASADVQPELVPIAPLVAEPLDQQAPAGQLNRRVHTFQFSDTRHPGRRRPCSFTREQYGVLLQRRLTDHFNGVRNSGLSPNKVLDVWVFHELHADGKPHLYGIALCERPYKPGLIMSTLREEDKIFTSASLNHTYLWTAIVYASVPSTHKSPGEIDSSPWNSLGKTVREELANPPKGARVSEKERVLAHLGLPGKANKVRAPVVFTPEELSEYVRSTGEG